VGLLAQAAERVAGKAMRARTGKVAKEVGALLIKVARETEREELEAPEPEPPRTPTSLTTGDMGSSLPCPRMRRR